MKTKNAIIIGASIVIAALIIVWRMPRYQYCQTCCFGPRNSEGESTEYVEDTVFDMVTGKAYRHSSSVAFDKEGRVQPKFTLHQVYKMPRRPLIKAWKKQLEVFPDEGIYHSSQWNAWKRENGWD